MTELMLNPTVSTPRSNWEIAEKLLGKTDWVSPTMGYCLCPGKRTHSTNNGTKDCIVYLDRVPTIHCVHASCKAALEAANRKLRSAILNPDDDEGGTVRKLTEEDKARIKERENALRLRRRMSKSLPQMLANFAWSFDQIRADSPVAVAGNMPEHAKLLLKKFQPDDVVWLGDKFDSGKPEHAAHFKPVSAWLKESRALGPLICPVAFKNTSHARTNDNVLARRFLVVESDTLSRDDVGAVFKWLHAGCDLKLIAIVDTAGKSLHGWFDFADCEESLDDLKLLLPSLQCDPKLFTPSQPVRLPGVLRDGVPGKMQRLVWLTDTEVAHV